jgi:hypothetical protein
MATRVLAAPPHAGQLPSEIELACDVIDRLELHRRCLDEAVADAYAELAALLVRHLEEDPALLDLLA